MKKLFIIFLCSLLSAQEPDFGFDLAENPQSEDNFSAPSLQWRGEVSFRTRGFYLEEEPWNGGLEPLAETRITLEGVSGPAQAKVSLQINPTLLETDPASIMTEAWARYNSDFFYLEAGLLKPVWGRADGLRVLDILNPMNRTDFIHPAVIDQKIAQPMTRVVWTPGDVLRAEVAWTPFLEGDRLPTTGRWVPSELRTQLDNAYSQFFSGLKIQYESQIYAAAFAQAMVATSGNTVLSDAAADAEVLAQQASIISMAQDSAQSMVADLFRFPEPFRWENSQAGLRLSGTAAGFDWGAQYWYGFLRLPSADPDPAAALANGNHVFIHYDRVHHAGMDVAFNLLGFGVRAEGSLDATSDWTGDDRLVRNSSLAWSLGFDREIIGVAVVVEARQRILLGHGNVTQVYDLEKDSRFLDSLVLLRLSQSLFQDTLLWEFTGLYGVEDGDSAISPNLSWRQGDFEISLKGHFYFGRDTTGNFSQFYDQNFLELGTVYRF